MTKTRQFLKKLQPSPVTAILIGLIVYLWFRPPAFVDELAYAAPDVATLPGQRLSDLQGKVVLVNFWATWCPYCRHEMPAMQAFYREVLGLAVTPAFGSPVGVLQAAHGLPPTSETPLALVPLSRGFALELDGYPASAAPRPQREGDLPPGLAMVSFLSDPTASGSAIGALPWLREPAARTEAPYDGRSAGLLRGAAGEWLEIVLAR